MDNCTKLRNEYAELKSIKQEFDLEYRKALETGHLDRVRELKARFEQKRDFIRESLVLADPYEVTRRQELAQKLSASYVGAFSKEGLAVANKGDVYYFIDKGGQKIHKGEFAWARSFSEGLAVVQKKKDGPYSFIDKTGQAINKEEFAGARSFSEGVAVVQKEKNGPWSFIDKTGQEIAGGVCRGRKFLRRGGEGAEGRGWSV